MKGGDDVASYEGPSSLSFSELTQSGGGRRRKGRKSRKSRKSRRKSRKSRRR